MNRKNSYLKLIFLTCMTALNACNHVGNNSDGVKANNLNKVSGFTGSKEVPTEDLYSLNYDIRADKSNDNAKKTCFAESAICVTQLNHILGTYTLQQKGARWLIPDNLGKFKVELNYNKGNLQGGIRIKELFAELKGNPVQGYMTEINTEGCEKATPDSKGLATCEIHYAYHAITDNDKKNNINHMILAWKDRSGNEQSGEVIFDTFNFLDNIDNMPVIEMVGFGEVNHLENKIGEVNNDIYIGNSINNQIILQNVGDADLTPDKDEKYPIPDIHAATEKTNSAFNMQDLEFHNPDIPLNCRDNYRINRKDTCNFNFDYTRKFEKINDNEVLSSQIGRLVFKYYLPDDGGTLVNYVPKFILSAGHIDTTNLHKDLNESFNIYLDNVHNYSSELDPAILSYQLPKTDVKLSVEYKPEFFIPHGVKDGVIYYGIGDEAKRLTSTLILENTKNTSGDFFANDGNIERSTLSYRVGSTILEKNLPDYMPLGGVLVAEYYSGIIGRKVSQIIGTANIVINEADDLEPYNKYIPQYFSDDLLSYISPNKGYPDYRMSNHDYMLSKPKVQLCYQGGYDKYKNILRAYCWQSDGNGYVKVKPYKLELSKCKKRFNTQNQITFTTPDYRPDSDGALIDTALPICAP